MSQRSNNSSRLSMQAASSSLTSSNIPSHHRPQWPNNPNNNRPSQSSTNSSSLLWFQNSNVISNENQVHYLMRSLQGSRKTVEGHWESHDSLVNHMIMSEQGHGGWLNSSTTPSFHGQLNDMIRSVHPQSQQATWLSQGFNVITSYGSQLNHMIKSDSGHIPLGVPQPLQISASLNTRGKWAESLRKSHVMRREQGYEKSLEVGQLLQTQTSLNTRGKWAESLRKSHVMKREQGYEKSLEVGQLLQTQTSLNTRGKWVEWIKKGHNVEHQMDQHKSMMEQDPSLPIPHP
ncbi:hypothetical protein VNO77_07663 [Canavalia gladiata]|uniref:Uncharacterized protein n=1 Tax=Canavalia gladiata TaxID=3824 RepID=A0AAN9QWR2_CANGL